MIGNPEMNIDLINEIRKKSDEKHRGWRKACKETFKTGENMSRVLAGFGIEKSPVTCRSWLNGDTSPSYIRAEAIWAIIELQAELQISDARARIENIRKLQSNAR